VLYQCNRGAERAHGLIGMPNLRNLSRRPAKPALGNGRVQRGALRAPCVLGIASTSEIAEWTHARARAYGELSDNHTRAARRALDRVAARTGGLSFTKLAAIQFREETGRPLGYPRPEPGVSRPGQPRELLSY
jgi:hypothetical protein